MVSLLQRVTFGWSPKVTKRLLPHHSAPRLGSVCPHSGITPRAAATRHPWRGAAKPASLPVYPLRNTCVRPVWFNGAPRSRSRSTARRPDSRPEWLDQRQIRVGAGLPAMQATRLIRNTQSMPSQASQLPQKSRFDSALDLLPLCALDQLQPLKPAVRPLCCRS